MADLRQFQNESQVQAQLQNVQAAPPPSTTPALALGSFLADVAPTVVGAVSQGRANAAALEQKSAMGGFLHLAERGRHDNA